MSRLKKAMTQTQEKYEAQTKQLKELQEEQRQCEADEIVAAYLRSNKSFDELMILLNP